jgi:hypothetical protein
MEPKGRDFAALGMTVNPTVATAAPHMIPVSTLRRSITSIGLLLIETERSHAEVKKPVSRWLGSLTRGPAI